jgi:hypothetical protein
MSLSDCTGAYFERPSALGFKCSTLKASAAAVVTAGVFAFPAGGLCGPKVLAVAPALDVRFWKALADVNRVSRQVGKVLRAEDDILHVAAATELSGTSSE